VGVLGRFVRSRSGGVAVSFGLVVPLLLGVLAAAIEYGSLVHRRDRLQNAADTGALAAARELSLAGSNMGGVAGSARAMALASLSSPADVVVEATVTETSVDVTIRETVKLHLGAVLGIPASQVAVRAVARIAPTRLCLLALEPQNARAIDLNRSARLTALECSVFSNSTSTSGIVAADSSRVDAENVCSAGGISGKGNFVRPPTTDCPQIADPLAKRAPPEVGGCTFARMVVKGGVHTLRPGVYCEGLRITGGAIVTLEPGVYVVKDGKLAVDAGATLEGEDVGLFLTGRLSTIEFGYDTTISLAAPKAGEMAGILIFDARGEKADKHRIYSNNARKLLGTIYMPDGALYIDAKRPIADRSAYTVVIARTVEIFDGPDLVLNSDYNATSVPVPKGVGPVGSAVTLVK
jgi:Flp pilus assembly protein TadG